MENNLIGYELDEDEINIIKEYKDNGKLHSDWFPLTTYDMVQSGYPSPTHGEMIARGYGGTDKDNNLLPSKGMWCKVDDVKTIIPVWYNVIKIIPEDDINVLCYHEFSGNYFICHRTLDCLTKEPKWFGGAMPTHWKYLDKP